MNGRSSIVLSVLMVAAVSSPAWSASGGASLPQSSLSEAFVEGGADLSNGITPAEGFVEGFFGYGGDAGVGTQTTTVDFTLPAGVTVASDVSCDLGFGTLCLEMDTNCDWSTTDPTKRVTVSGNTVSFRLACDAGEGMEWIAGLSSLISTPGSFNTSAQFKTTVLKRAKTPTNMWQIKIPGSFGVN